MYTGDRMYSLALTFNVFNVLLYFKFQNQKSITTKVFNQKRGNKWQEPYWISGKTQSINAKDAKDWRCFFWVSLECGCTNASRIYTQRRLMVLEAAVRVDEVMAWKTNFLSKKKKNPGNLAAASQNIRNSGRTQTTLPLPLYLDCFNSSIHLLLH